jgi:radical SAM protein with 4Fe4S-binding SPASM domain
MSSPAPAETPWLFNIEITNRCPLKCVMCARTTDMTRDEGDMDMALYTHIVDQLAEISPPNRLKNRLLRLHQFGESLVHPEFHDMIRYAADRGFRVALSINPILLKDGIADRLLASGIDSLFISLDGHDDESFYQIRGLKNSYGRSVERLEKFLRKKQALGLSMHIELSMINFKLNRQSIGEMQDYWCNHPGIDDFRNKEFMKWDGSADDINALADDQSNHAIEETIEKRGGCNLPWNQMAVMWDGRVVPCCYDYDGKYLLGDVREKSLIDIWLDEPMAALRREFESKNVSNALCVNCEFSPGRIPQLQL